MKISKKSLMKDLLLLVAGNIILALAVVMFILPQNILSGGIVGMAIALQPLMPSIDTQIIIYGIIIVTFFLGLVFLGKEFALKTIFSSIFYPVFLELLPQLGVPAANVSPLIASIYGGLLTGTGVGLVFRAHGSTGGMDVFPLILNKYTGIPVSKLVLGVDAVTVLLGLYTYDLNAVLIGLIAVWTTSAAIDQVMMFGGEKAKSVYIISEHYNEISDMIHKEINRGTTFIMAEGGYSKAPRQIILCVIMQKQYPDLQELVEMMDPNAFMITHEAHEVAGEGFTKKG